MCYSKVDLLQPRTNALQQIAKDVYDTLKELNICRVKPTKRGSRSFKKQQQPISTIITSRNDNYNGHIQHASRDNLKSLPIHHEMKPNLTTVQIQSPPPTDGSSDHVFTRIGHWNARSMNEKVVSICDLIIEYNLDILIITESWLKGNQFDDHINSDLATTLPNYSMCHVPRPTHGGGVYAIVRNGFQVSENATCAVNSFEHMDLSISHGSSVMRLFAIYRPPPSTENKLTSRMFLTEFSTFVEEIPSIPHSVILIGDFNVHVDDNSDREAIAFCDILESVGLQQHIHEPTHRDGHTLDLLITRKSENCVRDTSIISGLPSDHKAVLASLDFSRPGTSKKLVAYRKLREIDIDAFKKDISSSLVSSPADDTSSLVDKYNSVLSHLLDQHAPQKTKLVTVRPKAPWYSETLHETKREKRRLERKMKKSGLETDKQRYHEQCKIYNDSLKQAKCDYHQEEIASCDDKELFRIVNKLCSSDSSATLPEYSSAIELANRFGTFFHSKIEKIRNKLDNIQLPKATVEAPEQCNSSFSEFTAVSEDTVREVIRESATKHCKLDPIPTWLTKDCLEELLPFITDIINSSLMSGSVPSTLKLSHILPLLKKPKLDRNNLQNYRPIANLSFISKVLERIVAAQLKTYMQSNNLFSDAQSAYRRYHSTETALLRVQNDLLLAIDQGQEAVLVMLDYSAAFDTIDHGVLYKRLQDKYGIGGTVLKWFVSYLDNRAQAVTIGDTISDTFPLQWGVPQGSVKGPLDFVLYTAPLSDIINLHPGIKHIIYADDTQLYLILKPSDHLQGISRLEACIADVRSWAIHNKLMLNDSKTEIIHIKSKFRNASPLPSIVIGGTEIQSSSSAKNLGVVIDSTLQMKEHIRKVCKSASYGVYKIGKLRKYLDQNSTERLVHALISSRLDCNNCLLYGLPSSDIAPLQRIQNAAARLVSLIRRQDHISPVLRKLHWLPVRHRILFKLLLLTYKAKHGLAPTYITELISDYAPSTKMSLRSSSQCLLTPGPRTNTCFYGDRAFSTAAPLQWNKLPVSVRTATNISDFKKKLKTHLFNKD